MNTLLRNSAGKQVGVGLTLVISVALVTFVFSFLGTILAAALVGMMVGFARQWRWQFVLISLAFPAALIASMQFSRSAVSLRETLSLSSVGFGTFWVTCILTRGLAWLERQSAPASPSEAANPSPAPTTNRRPEAIAAEATPAVARDAALTELQGTWLCESTAPDGKPCKKVIEVNQQELALRLVDRAGKVRVLARGDLAVEKLGAFKTVKVTHRESDPSGFWAEELGLPGRWLYRVVDDKLTVAMDFEETAADREPLLETYVRSREF